MKSEVGMGKWEKLKVGIGKSEVGTRKWGKDEGGNWEDEKGRRKEKGERSKDKRQKRKTEGI